MAEILTVVKRPNGVAVIWSGEQGSQTTLFEYKSLQEMRINPLDLLNNQALYSIDPEKKIIRKKDSPPSR